MDIFECHNRYGITLKKLRKMAGEGVLRIEKQKTPDWWLQVATDIRKGTMSARSVALAYRYPERLENLVSLTAFDRQVIDQHFKTAELPASDIQCPCLTGLVRGAAENNEMLLAMFVPFVKNFIPDHDIRYLNLAVRIMLTCETDSQINDMSRKMTRALSNAKKGGPMKGWWHLQDGPYGKKYTVYHRPRRYDL